MNTVITYLCIMQTNSSHELLLLWIVKRCGVLIIAVICCLFRSQVVQCQSPDSALSGVIIGAGYAYQVPGGDMAKRFGNNSSAGALVYYKSKANWFYGIDFNFLFSGNVKETGMMDSITTSSGQLIDQGGFLANVFFQERGFSLSVKTGKRIDFLTANVNSGPVIMVSGGFLQHKIRIDYNKNINNPIPQIEGEYKKGYDRLSNGPVLSEFIGYTYFGKNRMVNFIAGFEFFQAWTKNRRFNIDLQRRNNAQRLDLLYGIRISWVFPVFRRLPDKYYYN
ncbi:MAG: hypothetical protein HYY40_09325 [Bacteroidetes bacterium]|nr:hypothetical protein [Bacteroidota bacterium]